MAQLAGTELTRQAIFLVEAGKARPSMRTLEMIAKRTGKTVEFFMSDPVDKQSWLGSTAADAHVEELQALCLQQKFDKAITIGLSLLESPMAPGVEAHVRYYVGQAMVRSTQPDLGLQHLHRAQVLLERQPDPWLAVECADWEACALYLKEDKRALSVAEHALALCRSTDPRLPGTEARILEHIATIHVKNHAFELAITFYQEALQVAGTMRDLPRLGRTYHGLSIAYQERGEIGKAIEYTHKALALYALEHDTALLARGENELGLLLMRGGQLGRAEESFRTALAHFDEAGTERAKSHVLVSLGELQLRSGRHADAIETAKKAIALAKRLDEPLAQADGHVLLAQLDEKTGKHELADKEFGLALKLLAKEGQEDRLAEVHASFAEILEARGDERRASRQWKQAAKLALQKQADPLRAAQSTMG
jgi:tetratricopeptide (TPR) repeat protein